MDAVISSVAGSPRGVESDVRGGRELRADARDVVVRGVRTGGMPTVRLQRERRSRQQGLRRPHQHGVNGVIGLGGNAEHPARRRIALRGAATADRRGRKPGSPDSSHTPFLGLRVERHRGGRAGARA